MKFLLLLSLLLPFAYSLQSSFLGSRFQSISNNHASLKMYTDDAWTALARTEKWISEMTENIGPDNPYARKEVSYNYEPLENKLLVTANLFTKLADIRKVGEEHAAREEERAEQDMTNYYEPSTLRQTNVIVMPAAFQDFAHFDQIVETINEARRQARDFVVTTTSNDQPMDWNVAVNCAHLHPDFGASQPLPEPTEDWEKDPKYLAYREQKMKARRAPYPTIVLEVRAMPPPDMGGYEPPVPTSDIAKLESLFGQSTLGDPLHDALEQHLESLNSVSPLEQAQEWISKYHESFEGQASITHSDCSQVDEAFSFLLTNASMLLDDKDCQRQFCVIPNFLPSAATSLEKFGMHLQNMLNILLSDDDALLLEVSTLHPEHVNKSCRSPMSIVCLKKKKV